ncbi:hypothetical protein C7974DRAFT_429248 [Boeremia exigua]|uniref:uncharacterized protein n=1 Tax=Boeremia exigua TaxID=749465 RepID=UPI001E8E2202|nr:uncharacterized protein C7974DRAFT_429248 [Boeremia exigua]KAH6611800.1 hypothetical protein C7974DRAFT_429248 [Boeremia exigua]
MLNSASINEEQYPRKRASRACTMCHLRKVKCDALSVYPCTKCKVATLRCVLRSSYRRQNTISSTTRADKTRPQEKSIPEDPAAAERVPSPTEACDSAFMQSHLPPVRQSGPSFDAHGTTANYGTAFSSMDAATGENVDRAISHIENQTSGTSAQAQSGDGMSVIHVDEKAALPHVLGSISLLENQNGIHIVPNSHLPLRTADASNGSLGAPEWYSKALSQLGKSTRIFLSDQAILVLPRVPVMEALLGLFFEHVHPHFPVVEKDTLLEGYATRNYSLLVLNCMFALASHFASESLVMAAGVGTCGSKVELVDHFAEKARLLADFELERDREAQVAGFLLLTQMWQTWTMERNPRYWMSRAANVGMAMGLFRRVRTMQISREEMLKRNRLALLLLTCDAFIATGVGAPMTIAEEDIEQELHAEQQYFEGCVTLAKSSYSSYDRFTELNFMTTSASIGLILRAILKAFYSARPEHAQRTTLDSIERKLQFFDTMIAQVPPQDSQVLFGEGPRDRILAPLLRMQFLCTCVIHYRGACVGCGDDDMQLRYENCLLTTVVEMCQVASYLNSGGFVPFCPGWITTALFHASAVLLEFFAGRRHSAMPAVAIDFHVLLRQLIGNLETLKCRWNFAAWMCRTVSAAYELTRRKVDEGRKGKQQQTAKVYSDIVTTENMEAFPAWHIPFNDDSTIGFDWNAILFNMNELG